MLHIGERDFQDAADDEQQKSDQREGAKESNQGQAGEWPRIIGGQPPVAKVDLWRDPHHQGNKRDHIAKDQEHADHSRYMRQRDGYSIVGLILLLLYWRKGDDHAEEIENPYPERPPGRIAFIGEEKEQQ